jgi:polyphosphate glucokinase
MKILVLDIGGNHVKLLATGQDEARKVISGPDLTAPEMVERVRAASADWDYDLVTIGFPGPVIRDRPVHEPVNLGNGWVEFDYEKAFGKPVRMLNDAAMQALGSYDGGKMLFLGLGTGLGSTMIVDGVLVPMELGHLPYKKRRTFEEYVGRRALKRLGWEKWVRAVEDVVYRLKAALNAEYVVLGGGNAKKLARMPPGCRLGDNRNAFAGGFRAWEGAIGERLAASAQPASADGTPTPARSASTVPEPHPHQPGARPH